MFKNFLEVCRLPPSHDHQPLDVAGAPRSWTLIDTMAYIADRRNSTTTYGRMSNNVEIQVTFCTSPPPLVSYFCFWFPKDPHLNKIASEPRVIAAEADLVVISVALDFGAYVHDPQKEDIFVYQAGCRGKGPSLHRIAYQGFNLFFNVGVLRHRNYSIPDDDQYYIVGLEPFKIPWQFTLNLFDSNTASWSSRTISLDRQHQHSQFRHSASKVILLGEGSLMGFVDSWRGILVCDVLACAPPRYISFPRPLKRKRKLHLNPEISRDIAVVQGCIKVVDCFQCPVSGAWEASVWSRTTTWEQDWCRNYKLVIGDVLVGNCTVNVERQPNLQDGHNMPQTLKGLHITQPTLSLSDDSTVYFMAKVDPWDEKAWVLAVDMRNKKLQDVGVFHVEKSCGLSLSYIRSSTSNFFSTPPGNYNVLDADVCL